MHCCRALTLALAKLSCLKSYNSSLLSLHLIDSTLQVSGYRKTSNRSPRLLLEHFTFAPGLYWRPGFYFETRLLFKHCQFAILNFL